VTWLWPRSNSSIYQQTRAKFVVAWSAPLALGLTGLPFVPERTNAGVLPLRLRSGSRMTTRNKQQQKQKRRWIIGWTQLYGIFSCPV